MPVWGVWLDERFAVQHEPASRARHATCSKIHGRAVHLEDGNAVIVIEGRAGELRDPAELLAFLEAYNPKYNWNFTPDQVARGVFAIRPDPRLCVARRRRRSIWWHRDALGIRRRTPLDDR